MIALVIQHLESEGVGTLGDFLKSKDWELDFARLYEGCQLSAKNGMYDLVVSMGGTMNVYEEEKYPFLADETKFLREKIERGTTVLGVCLGAQMMAKAMGAQVVKSPAKEVGWGEVFLNNEGLSDKLFAGIKNPLKVFQWHGDMFHVPESGVLLGYSELCPHQAFRINRSYGFQFHIEADAGLLSAWFDESPQKDAFVREHDVNVNKLKLQSEIIYSNLIGSITQ
ncbi:MAG: type 1 glutamine amidotransferase [Syntrophaceae bacterium]|nr:type 1 glutamine amidotransferase [Syntrophaceae bacterium]